MILEVKDIHFSYNQKKILNGASFFIKLGEIVSLVGASGSGKTTLFRLISALLKPEKGLIQALGPITYMHQEDLLLPWRTALGNLLLTGELGKGKKDLKKAARLLLKKVGLEGYEDYYPGELSGGMKQRVSLARALLQNHPLLLLDEPFGSLDVIIREELYALLRQIAIEEKITILFVTHDFRDALMLSDRVLVLAEQKIAGNFPITSEIRSDPIKRDEVITAIRERLKN